MHVKYNKKNEFVVNVWPANSALFIYVSTHCVETVDSVVQWQRIRLGCKRYRVQFPAPARVFMFYILFCCCFVFTVCQKTHYLSQNVAIPFSLWIYLVYLTYCKICDRLYGYKDTDLASFGFKIILDSTAPKNSFFSHRSHNKYHWKLCFCYKGE